MPDINVNQDLGDAIVFNGVPYAKVGPEYGVAGQPWVPGTVPTYLRNFEDIYLSFADANGKRMATAAELAVAFSSAYHNATPLTVSTTNLTDVYAPTVDGVCFVWCTADPGLGSRYYINGIIQGNTSVRVLNYLGATTPEDAGSWQDANVLYPYALRGNEDTIQVKLQFAPRNVHYAFIPASYIGT